MAEDYYKTLGVGRNATQDDIQKAYRNLARKYHPDLNPDDKKAKQKFQEVQAAFDVLNDPSKRELYDRYGSAFESMGAGGGPRGAQWGGPTGGHFDNIDLSQIFGGQSPGGFADLFESMRGGRGRSANAGKSKQGADVATDVTVPFATAILGGEISLNLEIGQDRKTIDVKIPAGLDDGQKIRLRGQGEPATRRGGSPGDLILTVHVAPHPSFQRRGNHLDLKVPVTLAEASLGAKIDIPTPRGTIGLKIPAGTSSGSKLRVKGRGVAPAQGEPGDLFAEVQIVIPKQLDERSQELIRQLDAHWKNGPANLRQDLRW